MTDAARTGAVDELTYRVLAPNPSPMTLEGTNTYLLGMAEQGERIVVDPGPDLSPHRSAVDRALAHLGADVVAVIVTHHHADHAEASGWAQAWEAPLLAFDPGLVPGARRLHAGQRLRVAGITLDAVHTPGHASDHVCLRIDETGAVLSGDHVLGRGTSVVAWPDGELDAYVASLHRLRDLAPVRLDPGHGPSVDRPADTIEEYLAHREERTRQILRAMHDGATTPRAIAARVYADVDPVLHPPAERSVRAHLAKLLADGRITLATPVDVEPPRFHPLGSPHVG